MKVSARFKPYPEYKDSGVEWLGKIPEGWELVPALAISHERKEINKKGEVLNFPFNIN